MNLKIDKMSVLDLDNISSELQSNFDDFWTTSLLKSFISSFARPRRGRLPIKRIFSFFEMERSFYENRF